MRLKFLLRDNQIKKREGRGGIVRKELFAPKWVLLPHIKFDYGPEDLLDDNGQYTMSISEADGSITKLALRQIDAAFSVFQRSYYSKYGEFCDFSYNKYGLLIISGFFHSVYVYEPSFSKTTYACRFEWATVTLEPSSLFLEPVLELTISSQRVVFSPAYLRAVVPSQSPRLIEPRGRYVITERLMQTAS